MKYHNLRVQVAGMRPLIYGKLCLLVFWGVIQYLGLGLGLKSVCWSVRLPVHLHCTFSNSPSGPFDSTVSNLSWMLPRCCGDGLRTIDMRGDIGLEPIRVPPGESVDAGFFGGRRAIVGVEYCRLSSGRLEINWDLGSGGLGGPKLANSEGQ